jgi:hypothetical protein
MLEFNWSLLVLALEEVRVTILSGNAFWCWRAPGIGRNHAIKQWMQAAGIRQENNQFLTIEKGGRDNAAQFLLHKQYCSIERELCRFLPGLPYR